MPAETAVDVEKPRARQDLASASTIKTILVHVQNDKSVGDRLETALSIARATSAHVSCLHVTPIQAYGAWGDFAGVLTMNDAMNTLEKEEAQLREKVEAKLGGEDVSWDYEQVTGDVIEEIVRRSTLTDLVVTGREPFRSDYAGSVISILGDVLHWSRTPLFIPVHDAPVGDLNGSAVIAWDGSCEAANAVKSALGLLKLASDIRILQVRQSKPKGKEFPGTKLLEYLSRQGMHAELILEDSSKSIDGEDFIAASLMGHARSLNAAYVVMGGYGHSRIGEFLFGGVTRIMLSRSSVPLVIAH